MQAKIRATNTGLSQVINPYGKVIATAKPFEREIVIVEVRLNNKKTFYSKYGDLTLTLFVFIICCGTSVLSISKKVRFPH